MAGSPPPRSASGSFCPMCGGEVVIDARGRPDCAEHHRRDERELWLRARSTQLADEIGAFLHPTDAAPACRGHRWVLSERILGIDVLLCRRCQALCLADEPSEAPGA